MDPTKLSSPRSQIGAASSKTFSSACNDRKRKCADHNVLTAPARASNLREQGGVPNQTMAYKIGNGVKSEHMGSGKHIRPWCNMTSNRQTPLLLPENEFPLPGAVCKEGRKTSRCRTSRTSRPMEQVSTPPISYVDAAKRGKETPSILLADENSPSTSSLPPISSCQKSTSNRLRPPSLLPYVQTGRSADRQHNHHWVQPNRHRRNQEALLSKANDVYQKKGGAAARRFSDVAKGDNAAMMDAADQASERLSLERREALIDAVIQGRRGGSRSGTLVGNQRGVLLGGPGWSEENDEAAIDLHTLHVKGAIKVLKEFLLGLQAECFSGLAYVLVGNEHHREKGIPGSGLRTAIGDWLVQEKYKWANFDGVLCIDPRK